MSNLLRFSEKRNPVFLKHWLALTLSGWTAYSLLHALRIVIKLGSPCYDWQWYLPVSIAIITLPMQMIWRRPVAQYIRIAYVGLILWIVVGYNGFGYSEQLSLDNTAPITISFWAPYTDFGDVPESVLLDLQTAQATLYLQPRIDFKENIPADLAIALRRLATYDIAVILVPDISDFLSAPVHKEWIAHTLILADFVQSQNLHNVRGFIGDAEAPLHASFVSLQSAAIEVNEATHNLANLIDTFHDQYPNQQIGITAVWPLYIDGIDGDNDLAVLWRSPVDPPGKWDFVNVMVYSSFLPKNHRAYWVASTERYMTRRFPSNQVSFLIGLVGGGFPWEPLLDFDSLVNDALICRALGADEIVVFQIKGALQSFGNDFVQRFATAVNEPRANLTASVSFSRPTSVRHFAYALLDAILDIRGPKIWFWLLWTASSGFFTRLYIRSNKKTPRSQKIPAFPEI